MPAQLERLVVVYGNCQAHYLAAILAGQGVGLVCIVGTVFGFVPESRGLRPAFVSREKVPELVTCARAVGQGVVFLEQKSPIDPGLPPEEAALADAVICFPHLEAQSFWPHLSAAVNRHSQERIKRRWAFDLAAMRRSEAKAGWDGSLSNYIEDAHKSTSLFNTFNHPGPELMTLLHRRICDSIDEVSRVDHLLVNRGSSEISNEGGISFMLDHPLAESVIEALDLDWARSGWYASWVASIGASANGDMIKSRELVEQALSFPKCDPHAFYTYGLILEALGDLPRAHEAFGRVHRAYPHNPEYARRWLAGLAPPGSDKPHPLADGFMARYPTASFN